MIRATKTPLGAPAKWMCCTGHNGGGRCTGPPTAVYVDDDGHFSGEATCDNPHHIAAVDNIPADLAATS